MKQGILSLVIGAVALTAASAASARVNVSIGINPFGYGVYAPPVVYQPAPYYAAPQWSILAEDLGVVIAGGAREVTLVGAGTAEIQPGLDAGRGRSAV
jgi:hypothetical protein